MTIRDAIFPAGRHALYDKHRYSAAVRSGDLLFVSGQVGSREDGTPEPDFKRQVQLAFDNLKAVLEAAGGYAVTVDGEPLLYGKIGAGLRNPGFVAWGPKAGASRN